MSFPRLAAAALLAGAALAAGCAGGEEPPPTLPDEKGEAAVTTNPLIPMLGPARPPILASGRGAGRRTIELGDGPLIASGRFAGSGRMEVLLAAGSRTQVLVFAGRAPLEGERFIWWLDAGAYSLRVRAPGDWRLTLRPWRPKESDRALSGEFSGAGPTVVPVRVESRSPSSVAVDYDGRSTFSLIVLPFTPYSEEVTLAQASRGPLDRRFPVSLPPGDYAMQVEARGAWRLSFTAPS
jgi:hypothetical protein